MPPVQSQNAISWATEGGQEKIDLFAQKYKSSSRSDSALALPSLTEKQWKEMEIPASK